MVAVVLLVVLWEFAVAVVGGADGAAGALVGTVGQDEDLPGQTCLHDAVGAGCCQIVGAAWCRTGEPERRAVRTRSSSSSGSLLGTVARAPSPRQRR
jgi:hypothetical protein